jgi:hypothetical protein
LKIGVQEIQLWATTVTVVDGTTVNTPVGSSSFPFDPERAASYQAEIDAKTGITGTTVAQFFAANGNVSALSAYKGNSIYVNSSFPSGTGTAMFTIFHEVLHSMGYSDQALETAFGITPSLARDLGSRSITFALMGGCGQ